MGNTRRNSPPKSESDPASKKKRFTERRSALWTGRRRSSSATTTVTGAAGSSRRPGYESAYERRVDRGFHAGRLQCRARDPARAGARPHTERRGDRSHFSPGIFLRSRMVDEQDQGGTSWLIPSMSLLAIRRNPLGKR